MARRLVDNVVLRHPETDVTVVFEIGDKVPDWAAALITNTAVYGDADESKPKKDPKPSPATPPSPAPAADAPVAAPADGGGDGSSIPSKTGKGSGAQAWREYAASKGIEFDDADIKRDDMIAALVDANIPTE